VVIHYSADGPAEGADGKTVAEDTLWMRLNPDKLNAGLRDGLRLNGVEPETTFVIHFYPDNPTGYFICVVTADDQIITGDLWIKKQGSVTLTLETEPMDDDLNEVESNRQMVEMVRVLRTRPLRCPVCFQPTLPSTRQRLDRNRLLLAGCGLWVRGD